MYCKINFLTYTIIRTMAGKVSPAAIDNQNTGPATTADDKQDPEDTR